MKKICLKTIAEDMNLEVITKFDNRKVFTSEINRAGLQLAGHYDYFDPERIQIIGKSEMSFYNTFSSSQKKEVLKTLMEKNIVCLIITRNLYIPKEMIEIANENKCNLLRTNKKTTNFIARLTDYMNDKLSPTKTLHGVLVDVYGVGILIFGKSGIGKSETALELIKRGHSFIADDAVEIKKNLEGTLIGKAPELIKNFLEIRGIGILNISKLYGIGAVRASKKIDLVVNFKQWRDDEPYDRLGLEQKYIKILDISVETLDIPVKPGRNLAIITEAAAKNYKQKIEGYNAALELDERVKSNNSI